MRTTRRKHLNFVRSSDLGRAVQILGIALFATTLPSTASAVDFQGTVTFSGNVVFAQPIAGIALEDLTVAVKSSTEATGNGEKCSIVTSSSDNADALGAYPSIGAVSAEILLERGGGNIPDGDCIVTLTATGSDGAATSAKGSQTVFVPAALIDTGGAMGVADIIVRESRAISGLDKDCFKWVKKQMKARDKCNARLLKDGAAGAEKCKDAGPEPGSCDPGAIIAATLQLAHENNDQQVDPPSAEAYDPLLKDQSKCQKRLGKAAVNFLLKYAQLINKKCALAGTDSEQCRSAFVGTARKKLTQVDKCVGDQMVDGATGRNAPVAGAPCDVCFSAGVLDRKCMKSCFEATLVGFGDSLIGDVPECGNGIVQSGEFCDDGNLTNGDCCSSACDVEDLGDQMCGVGACEVTVPVCDGGMPGSCTPGTPSVEGPLGDATCTDGIDNDCDGDTDGADVDCQ